MFIKHQMCACTMLGAGDSGAKDRYESYPEWNLESNREDRH